MEHLPNELLASIFEYLNIKDLPACRLVSFASFLLEHHLMSFRKRCRCARSFCRFVIK